MNKTSHHHLSLLPKAETVFTVEALSMLLFIFSEAYLWFLQSWAQFLSFSSTA